MLEVKKFYRATLNGIPGVAYQGPFDDEWTWFDEFSTTHYHIKNESLMSEKLIIGEEVYISTEKF